MTADELRALIPPDWLVAIESVVPASSFEQLARRLGEEQRAVFPLRGLWFRALHETHLADVRAVIIGQDPYPTRGQADGLAFSVPDAEQPPSSLRRIIREAEREATIIPGRSSLVQWARRGVLLLNTALTVPEGTAGGHVTIGWQPMTDAILRVVASRPRQVVFLTWGTRARKAIGRAGIKDGYPHVVSFSVHPMERRGNFIGSNPFGRANDRLRVLGLAPIDWSVD
jgi:uracil-DNA glycosylase